jgi:hypothetical protein
MKFNSYEIFYERTRKRGRLYTGDCLIEVTAWVGFTVYLINHVGAKAICWASDYGYDYYTLAVFTVQQPFYINLMESKQVFLLMNFLNQKSICPSGISK